MSSLDWNRLDPARWREIQALLDDYLEVPQGQRNGWLEARCGDPELRAQVEELAVAAEAPDPALERPAARLTAEPSEPETLGPYRLVERIERGGMGSVFLAERSDLGAVKQVALKLLQLGLGSEEMIRRFRREREILSQMQHPNIAQLLDGGTAPDGRPYLVMELVTGTPIHHFCASRNLSVDERLRLFIKVCSAVHFAHQHLVVHRDLKPDNILVTDEGEPKLLDFGIAKLLSTESFPLTVVTTRPEEAFLTPAYASPEQLRGERITTASDVYALGILLYELLAGVRPHHLEGLSRAELVFRVCEEPVALPSAAAKNRAARRRLRGDLDTIVLMALRREPARRYISAEQLAEDLERFRQGLPVLAHKDSLGYRAKRFVGRNRAAVASALTALLALLAFVSLLLQQRRELLVERDRFERTASFFIDLFEDPLPERRWNEQPSARDLLDRGAAALTRDLADQPELQTDLRRIIGTSYHALGEMDAAEVQLTRALTEIRQRHPDPAPETAESLQRLAQLESDRGRLAEAEAHSAEALRLRRLFFAPPHPDLVDSLYRLAWVRERRGDYGPAEESYREAVAMARDLGDPAQLADVLGRFGILLRENAAYEEAEEILNEALALQLRLHGEEHAFTARTLNSLALVLQLTGRFVQAEEQLRRALATAREVYGESHREVATILANLGGVVENQGRYREAEEILLRVVAMGRSLYDGEGTGHPLLASYLTSLASLYEETGQRERAAPLAEEALAMRRGALGDEHKDVAAACDYLARIYQHLGRHEESDALFREALAIYTRTVDANHPLRGKTLNNLGALAFVRGERARALELFEEALRILRHAYGDEHPEVGNLAFNLGYLHQDSGDLERAEDFLLEALAVARLGRGAEHPTVGIIQLQLGRLALDQERWAEAEGAARSALEILAAGLPYEHNRRRQTERLLARSLLGQGLYEAAREAIAERYLWAVKALGPEEERTRDLQDLLREIDDAESASQAAARGPDRPMGISFGPGA